MSKKRIAVLISGNGSNLQAILDACQAGDINGDVVGVISNKAEAYGLARAELADVPAFVVPGIKGESRDDYDARLSAQLAEIKPDLVILAGYMKILTASLVEEYQGRMLNIHPSLLPKYPGLNTHQRALDAGDDEHGCSVHFVIPELDAGPVVLQAKVPVFENDDADELATRIHTQEHRIYPLVARWFCQDRLHMKQGEAFLDDNPLPTAGYATDD